ncbi:MAG: DUF1622 domain-containing protein [Phycisphaeraceae bacterium]
MSGLPDFIVTVAEWCAAALELMGIGVIATMAVYVLLLAAVKIVRGEIGKGLFRETRHRLAYGILLGLEFLVAADIIHTVAVNLTFTSVGVLAIVVLIRTFLSFTLEMEIAGRWPWQNKQEASG